MTDKLELADVEDNFEDLEAAHEKVTLFAREKERGATADAFRDENGSELADDDDSNMADVAAIDAFDEEDHENEQRDEQAVEKLGARLRDCDEETGKTVLVSLNDDIEAAKNAVTERSKAIGYKDDLF